LSTTFWSTGSARTTTCWWSTPAPRTRTTPGFAAGGRLAGVTSATTPAYYSQLAVQGPRALETLQKLTKVDLAAIKNYWFTWGEVAGVPTC
jgi:glycine cleavage system aminomethyltransferase T